jgi:glyoxylase-like metal-dependent hydrolase (beta-lactamase superfamily II)
MIKISLVLLLLATRYGTQAQTVKYTIYAIRFASTAHHFSIADWALDGTKTDSVKIDFMVWLIKGAGKNILVDAGFLKDIPEGKDFEIVNYTRPDSALAKVALKPEDITDIILTHPHWDHIDGITLFPKAHIWMQKDDYGYFVGSAWQKGNNGDNGGFSPRDVRTVIELNLAGNLTLIDGDNKEIIPGIKVFTGSRHTFNSQYVLVETGIHNTIIASDNIWIYYSLEHLTPASRGGTLDPAGYVKAMQRMKTMVTDEKYIIPAHDSQLFSRFPTIANGVVQIK